MKVRIILIACLCMLGAARASAQTAVPQLQSVGSTWTSVGSTAGVLYPFSSSALVYTIATSSPQATDTGLPLTGPVLVIPPPGAFVWARTAASAQSGSVLVVANAVPGSSGAASSISSYQGTLTTTEVPVAATTVTALSANPARKFLSLTNDGTGNCRIGYGGATPSATLGDPLNGAAITGTQGGARIFEASFIPNGTVSAYCSAASSFTVMEGQ